MDFGSSKLKGKACKVTQPEGRFMIFLNHNI